MDFWMIARQGLANDLPGIFSALGDLQFQYDWVITDTGLYFAPGTPDEVRNRWSWTGLLMTGLELTQHLSAGYVHFVSGGVLSAVPLGTCAEQVWNYVPSLRFSAMTAMPGSSSVSRNFPKRFENVFRRRCLPRSFTAGWKQSATQRTTEMTAPP